jgi:hypothetical protein
MAVVIFKSNIFTFMGCSFFVVPVGVIIKYRLTKKSALPEKMARNFNNLVVGLGFQNQNWRNLAVLRLYSLLKPHF